MKPKILAYHLPAYHRIPENDEWHGEGFTEWTTTKKGVAFSKHQTQPRVPLNNKYYDLSELEDIRWQCETARNYGDSVFIIIGLMEKKFLKNHLKCCLKIKILK